MAIVLGLLYFLVGPDGSQSSAAIAFRKIGSTYLGVDEDIDTTESPTVQEYVMDMKAHIGSFGVAMMDKNVWVMNVVGDDVPNTLKLVYDRGLIGSTHSW